MKTLGNSKTYFFMENESGDISFACRYNVNGEGDQYGGKVMLNLPQGLLVAVKQFVEKNVIPEIKRQEKI